MPLLAASIGITACPCSYGLYKRMEIFVSDS